MQTVRLEDVELGRVLGAGSMGQVHLVRYAGQPYALKSMSKAQLVRERLQVSGLCLRGCHPASQRVQSVNFIRHQYLKKPLNKGSL